MKDNQKIIDNLKNTYCRLKTSKLEGIGIFAIRDIPKNTNPFWGVKIQRWHKIKSSELKKLNKNVFKMVSDFFAVDENDEFSIPECGLNGIDISFFLNTSNKPNIKTIDDGTNFITIKKIKKGEELTVSYSSYDKRY